MTTSTAIKRNTAPFPPTMSSTPRPLTPCILNHDILEKAAKFSSNLEAPKCRKLTGWP
uniref:Uncharacterized protein n=1 Tax=Octopus bimaculoides TaxID=37653 RepID=A0A0L8HPE7_OCTBM